MRGQLRERAGALRADRHLGRLPARRRGAAACRVSVARRRADRGRLHEGRTTGRADRNAAPSHRLLPRLDDRQLLAGGSRRVPARRRAAVARRRPAGRRGSREGRAHAARRVQRRAGRDRAVQPEPARPRECGTRRGLRSRRVLALRVLRSRAAAHRDASRQRYRADGARARPCVPLRRRRAHPHGELAQVHDRRLPCDRTACGLRARHRVDRCGQPVQRALAAQRRRYPRLTLLGRCAVADRAHGVRAVRVLPVSPRRESAKLPAFTDSTRLCNGVSNHSSSLSHKASRPPVIARYRSRRPVSPVSAQGA
ncbi:hypothetical protein EMIT0158MI4_120267 [Burkholderia ambifaria]